MILHLGVELVFGSGNVGADESHGFDLAGELRWDGLIVEPLVQRCEDVFDRVSWRIVSTERRRI